MPIEVADLLQKHLADAPAVHTSDELEMELFDTEGADDSDSGLENLVGVPALQS